MPVQNKSSITLEITVVGASIAGLACAYALQRAGHHVLVLEEHEGPRQGGGGVRSPPNMSRILEGWGFRDFLADAAVKIEQTFFRNGETGEKMGAMPFHEQIMRGLRADFSTIKYDDLCRFLHDRAVESGATVLYGRKVVDVDPFALGAVMPCGRAYTSDLIIGADGSDSFVREIVLGYTAPSFSGRLCCGTLEVPAELMECDLSLSPLIRKSQWNTWLGDGSCVLGHPTHAHRFYALQIYWSSSQEDVAENWDDAVPFNDCDFPLDSYEPRVRKLLRMAKFVVPIRHVVREPLEEYVHEDGRVLLVGSAAHLLPPGGAHNAAMAIEDAVTLGNLFSRLHSHSQLPSILSAFEEVRLERSAQVLHSECDKMAFLTLPHGTEQRRRDAALREAMSQALMDFSDTDEEHLRETWEEFIAVCDYDANEVADDWWMKWGLLMGRGTSTREPEVEITVSLVTGAQL